MKILSPQRFPMHDGQTITVLTHKNIPSKIENKRQSVKIEDPRSVADDDPFGETDCSTHGIDNNFRGGAAYLYLISILIWPHFDTYPYISIQNILMRAQNILITKIYL